MIKLLFILPDLQGGGAERVVLTLLRHLDPSKYSTTLFLFCNKGVYWDEVPKHVRIITGTESNSFRKNFLIVVTRLVIEARKHDVIIGALELNPTYLAYIIGKCLNRLSVGWLHVNFTEYIKQRKWFHRYLSGLIYRRLNHLVCVSHGVAEDIQRFSKAEIAGHLSVIYNPFEQALITDSENDLPPVWVEHVFSSPVIISVGRLAHQKGFDQLIKAFGQLRNRGIECHLLILGEGPERPYLEALAQELGVGDKVFMPGFVDNPLYFMKRATLFVLSSRYEGFGMVLLEAMAAGLPIVSTDCPSGPAEILGNGKYGILVPVEEPAMLMNAMSQMITKQDARSIYQERGARRVEDFAPERIVLQWERLIGGIAL